MKALSLWQPLAAPVPARGHQGLWTPSADLTAEVEAAARPTSQGDPT